MVDRIPSTCRTFEYQELKIDSDGSESSVPIAPKESKQIDPAVILQSLVLVLRVGRKVVVK